ncbi:hypothetical protein [Bacillus sp. SM2101]|nr:hypothetical protein [Bacillus sp. SM2101]
MEYSSSSEKSYETIEDWELIEVFKLLQQGKNMKYEHHNIE